MSLTKSERRQRIKHRIRKIVSGTATMTRLSVFRSNKEIYAQLIDDVSGKTLLAASSKEKDTNFAGTNIEIANAVGKFVAEKALGRFLNTSEVIHHINGIKNDNRPENLYLFATTGEHTAYHHTIDKTPITESNLPKYDTVP